MSEFVPSGVIEKASVYDMIYAACPKCFTSMASALALYGRAGTEPLQVQCSSCRTSGRLDELQFKYRLKLQLVYGATIVDAILFDEATESLLGVSASEMKKELLPMYPNLSQLLEELLLGLRVSFSFYRPAPKRNANKVQFVRNVRITHMKPLLPQLLPEPAVRFAIKLLQDN